MVKHKNLITTHNKITTIFGYTLFGFTVLSFLVSTAIPFSITLTYPTARHLNIIVMVIAFAIATILPALASYFIGDKATHAKNKSLHHYNGVLFGIAAYWISQALSWIGFYSNLEVGDTNSPARLVLTNVIPVILTLILMTLVAGMYAKRQTNKASVLQYGPYQIVLIAGVLGAFVAPYLSGSFDMKFLGPSIATLAVPLVVIAIAYKVLAKYQPTRLARFSDAIIAMSVGWIATWLANAFIGLIRVPYQVGSVACYVIGLVVFVAFLYFRTRKQ